MEACGGWCALSARVLELNLLIFGNSVIVGEFWVILVRKVNDDLGVRNDQCR